MMVRLLCACFFSLLLLGLIPYLNRSRTAKELPIVSYRLHPFETKVTPIPKPAPLSKVEEKLEKAMEVSTTIPKPIMLPLSIPVSAMISSDLKFSASAMPGIYAKGAETVAIAEVPVIPKTQIFNIQEDNDDHLLNAPKFIVPLRARQLGISGTVTVQWEVNEKGLVENVMVVKSSNPIFDKPAIATIKLYKFKPFVDKSGNPVRVYRNKEFQIEVH